MTEKFDKNFQAKLEEVKRHYLLPIEIGSAASAIKRAADKAPEWIASPTKIFLDNIQAAITTVKIPYTSATTSVLMARFRQISIRHRILVESDSLTIENFEQEASPEERSARDLIAHERTLKQVLEEKEIPEIKAEIAEASIALLLTNLQEKEMEVAAQELLRQGVVMIWGAFEVLCRDVFVGCLNSNPSEVQKLVADSNAKKFFQVKGIGLEDLSEYGFDVSKNLGDLIANMHDLSSLVAIRQTFNALFPSQQILHVRLSDPGLWILHQRRHLIVHRRAVVDKQYLEKTGEKMQIGQQLTPMPAEIKDYIKLVCRAGFALVKAVAKL